MATSVVTDVAVYYCTCVGEDEVSRFRHLLEEV